MIHKIKKHYKDINHRDLTGITVKTDNLVNLKIDLGLSEMNVDFKYFYTELIALILKTYKIKKKYLYKIHITKLVVKKGDEFVNIQIND